MLSSQAFITFIIVFILLGSVGVLFDLLTGGSYHIRVTLVDGGSYASKKVRAWINLLVRGWVWSPLFALAVLLSPVLFVLVLGVYIFDSYRQYQVYYDHETLERVVYPSEPITEDTIKRAGTSRGWLRNFFGPTMTGIVYMGAPLPENFVPLTDSDDKFVKDKLVENWRVVTISGVEFLAPPVNEVIQPWRVEGMLSQKAKHLEKLAAKIRGDKAPVPPEDSEFPKSG